MEKRTRGIVILTILSLKFSSGLYVDLNETHANEIAESREKHANEIAELNELSEKHANEIAELNELSEKHANEIAELNELSEKHANEIAKLNELSEKHANEIAELRQEVEELQKHLTEVETKYVNDALAVNDVTKLHTGSHLMKKRAVRIRRIRVPDVAFQASLTMEYGTFKLYDAIIFNNVITNNGNAYDNQNGIFTATSKGTYIFNTNIVSERGHYIEASIQVNDRVTVSAISDHRVSENENRYDMWDQGSASAVLRLNKGDKVFVSVQWPQGSHLIHGVGKSSFSGFLLRSHS